VQYVQPISISHHGPTALGCFKRTTDRPLLQWTPAHSVKQAVWTATRHFADWTSTTSYYTHKKSCRELNLSFKLSAQLSAQVWWIDRQTFIHSSDIEEISGLNAVKLYSISSVHEVYWDTVGLSARKWLCQVPKTHFYWSLMPCKLI